MWKRCQRGGVLGKFIRDRFAGSKRFLKELIDSNRAIEEGLPVSEVLAIASIPTGRGFFRIEMLVRFEDGFEQLAEVLADPSTDWKTRVEVLNRTGDTLRSFHGCGFLHGDLNLMNILINRKPGSPVRVLLIDIDPGGLPPQGSPKQNLYRLATSHRKFVRSGMPSVSSIEALRFLNAYFGCDRMQLLETWHQLKLFLPELKNWDRFKTLLGRESQ